MDKIFREKLYNRITYIFFACLLIVTMFFPMFSIKTVTGERSDEVCSSVSALQIIRVGLKSEDELKASRVSLLASIDEFSEALEKEGKTADEIQKALKSNADYNEYVLIQTHARDMKVLKPMAICLLAIYIMLGVLALLFVLSLILNKDVLDTINMFATAAVAVVGIVVLILSFTLTYTINVYQSSLICGELMMYFIAIAPIAFAIIQFVQYFLARRKANIKASEVIKPFTGNEEE